MNKQDLKEKLIFFGFTIGVFLPIRVLFYSFVSTWWVGSFGMITIVMIILLYLVKKEKLGYVGRIWKKQILKISRGKLGAGIIVMKVFTIMIFASIVWATDMNLNTEETNALIESMNEQGIDGIDDIIAVFPESIMILSEKTPEQWQQSFELMKLYPERFGQLYAVIDNMTYGYHQHFNMVFLIEAMESLGIVLYFRFFYKKNEIRQGL